MIPKGQGHGLAKKSWTLPTKPGRCPQNLDVASDYLFACPQEAEAAHQARCSGEEPAQPGGAEGVPCVEFVACDREASSWPGWREGGGRRERAA
jgi:hypothetical protein